MLKHRISGISTETLRNLVRDVKIIFFRFHEEKASVFHTDYLQPHVDLVHSKKGFKDALARNGQFWTAMPVATPILENWLKMTCSVISSLQSKSQLRCNKLLKVVTDIQNMAANICDIEAKFTRSRSERVIPQAMQRFTELLEIKKEKMTRENQKKYIEDAKKFVQTKIPQGPDCQRAQFIIERAISQQYKVVLWKYRIFFRLSNF